MGWHTHTLAHAKRLTGWLASTCAVFGHTAEDAANEILSVIICSSAGSMATQVFSTQQQQSAKARRCAAPTNCAA